MKNERGNCRMLVRSAIIGLMLFVGLALVCAQGARAQTNQGAIAGNVLDASGAVVPNAKIVATNTTTGATYETVSTSAGAYRFPNLTVGPYDLTVTASGFKVATLHGVIVEVATTDSLDIKLTAGSVNETVTVNADTPTIQTETSEIGTVVTQHQVLDLPLVLGSSVQYMRSPEAFVFLIPGTVGPGSGQRQRRHFRIEDRRRTELRDGSAAGRREHVPLGERIVVRRNGAIGGSAQRIQSAGLDHPRRIWTHDRRH